MKQIKIFAAVAVVALAMSSCTTYMFTSRYNTIEKTNIEQSAMIVDVRPDFNKRIVTESRRLKSPTLAMEEAKYLAIVEHKCDVIVDPIYKVEKHGGKYKAYLTGFAGYYKNARTIYEDIKLLNDVKKEDLEKYLILNDPNIIGLMNSANNSEVINIYEGHPQCEKKEAPVVEPQQQEVNPEPAPVQEQKRTYNKKRKK
jgi:hypothetical protein